MPDNTPNNQDSTPSPSETTENGVFLAEPEKKKARWRPALIWLVPFIALLIALSLAAKAILDTGPTIEVSFRTAEGLVAGKTTVRYKQVDIGLVRQIDLSDDRSHVIAKIELRKDASNFAAKDSRFWVVRPRVGTGAFLELIHYCLALTLKWMVARRNKSRRLSLGLKFHLL